MSAVLYERSGAVATITLNRPEVRNALNLEMCDGIERAAKQAAADAEVRLVFVRAAGVAFCAGADLKERRTMDAAQTRERRLRAFAAYAALEALPMPAVAVVAGPAVGSGCEIAACCDFIVATPDAWFATPEALRGTVGATQRLARALGLRFAKDMMFTGRRLSAEEALRLGFVSRLVSPAALERELAAIARTVCEAPPQAMRLAKRCLDAGEAAARAAALARELEAIEEQLAAGGGLEKR
ncbi:MAG: enoyl-CoA hydratase/isomerase family protein [Burkholderiales bacterium]|nr:enoyl-CoA hydratase/isomerase family protein [Burkholderiales bacterium]